MTWVEKEIEKRNSRHVRKKVRVKRRIQARGRKDEEIRRLKLFEFNSSYGNKDIDDDDDDDDDDDHDDGYNFGGGSDNGVEDDDFVHIIKAID
ncbi:hypothetical protein ElyMa_001728600 [Elysia marginata]|uniref:Uncharacterized protein n=1 Tax=Elysia marginata TaxID=1093978 RepID=A0AAV4JVC6_9GAST|nr:hypothetical protein ElyMa_001728600 [Elysia marginata]